ncbi:unnamed protein product [Haemonchus placei]|uniref:DUF772 domain-containing protein n=1 Tax=Haemonchus placei TaxID=6290 RepID=A0A0N4W248_HAEPC|nr:unnamed protein product [Haemonchus placei]
MTDVAVVAKFYTGPDHRLLYAILRFLVRGERAAAKFRKRSLKTVVSYDYFASFACGEIPSAGILWGDSVSDNIDEGYSRLLEHLYDCARKTESLESEMSTNVSLRGLLS